MGLRDERERVGLTQQELAEKLGMSRRSIINYEANPEKMRIEIAYAICNILNCSAEKILTKDVN